MKAIVITGPSQIEMQEVPIPRVGPEDVLVRVAYSGICGTDLAILGGDMSLIRDGLIRYPVRIGHEWSGVVEQVGGRVKHLRAGDHVVSDTGVTCGVCEHCLKGDYGKCESARSVGTVNCWDGSFAEYECMPERHLHKVPGEIGLEEAALVEPTTIALAGIKRAELSPDSRVLVVGTGAIGLAAVGLLKSRGVRQILLSGRKPYKLDIGRQMGADVLINAKTQSTVAEVLSHTGGSGVDVVLETSGNISVLQELPDLAAPRGTIALIGFYEALLDAFPIDKLVTKELTLRGVMGQFGLVEEVLPLMAAGKLDLKPLITHRFSFDQAIDAMKTAADKNETKIKMMVKIG